MHDLAALLDHGLLILTGGHGGSLESGDIGSLTDGVAEEAHRDAGFEVAHLDLALHGGVALQTADGDQILVVEAQLGQLGHHGLDKDVHLVGVQTAGQIVQRHLQNVLAHLLRVVGVIGQRLRVGDHDKDLIVLAGVLQAHPLLQGTDIVAHMQAAGGAVAGQNDFFHDVLLYFAGRRLALSVFAPQIHLSQRERPWHNGILRVDCQRLPLWGSWRECA